MDAVAIQRELAQDLLPLYLAVDALCQALYAEERLHDELKDERRNLLAAEIASTAGLYNYDPERPSETTQLHREAVLRGFFRNGGKVFEHGHGHGHGSLTNLAVSKGAVEKLLALVAGQAEVAESRALAGQTRELRLASQALQLQARALVQAAREASKRAARLRADAARLHGQAMTARSTAGLRPPRSIPPGAAADQAARSAAEAPGYPL